MFKYVLIVLVIVFVSCIEETKKTGSKDDSLIEQKKKPADSELTARLYSQYYAEPKNQDERDQNALLDYAVDNDLDVTRTKTGLYYVIHQEGKGEFLKRAQPTRAHYTGYFLDGKIFDSSRKKGKPLSFKVGEMIPGWNEALLLMNEGTKAQLLIPSRLAYGPRGYRGLIPPNTPIIFDVEVMPLR